MDQEHVKETIKVLRKARNILAKRGAWTKGAYARQADGEDTRACSASAKRFCAVGAVFRATGQKEGGNWGVQRARAIDALEAVLPGYNFVSEFNDTQRSKGPVIAAFDRAIARLRKQTAPAE